MSFTTGALMRRECVLLAELFAQFGDWRAVRAAAVRDNLLQARTGNTLRRYCTEATSRLKTLSPDEMAFLPAASDRDQGYLLWAAVCRRYRFIADFATEVMYERYSTYNPFLPPDAFDVFFGERAQWHSEVAAISNATRAKLRRMLFQMLRQADLLDEDGKMRFAILSPQLTKLLLRRGGEQMLIFPIAAPYVRQMAG